MALPSTKKIIKALIKDGFQPRDKKSKRGSHQAYTKDTPDGKLTVIVPLNCKEIPIGTLSSILRQAGWTRAYFDSL